MCEFLDLRSLAARELPALCEFGMKSKVPAGFGYLGPEGAVMSEMGAQLWINCRMTHMFSLFALAGIHPEQSRELAAHGIHALREYFVDREYGGWFSWIDTELDASGQPRPNLENGPRKEAYAHAFVIIAASSATVAEIPGARELLDEARRIQDAYWWDKSAGRARESYARDWTELEDYRGANANMHTLESCLAAFDATADTEYLRRGASIATKIINESAREYDWRIPEHYTSNWRIDPDYNRDKPNDPFRPWGATPGHGFEWARLILQLQGAAEAAGLDLNLDWVHEAAAGLYRTALAAWGSDGADGIPYTTDFEGRPVSSQRMHWVICEAIGVSLVISKLAARFSSDSQLPQLAQQWADKFCVYAQDKFIQHPGQWSHELDVNNQPACVTWVGKADIYHAGQAMFLVNLPAQPGFAAALKHSKSA